MTIKRKSDTVSVNPEEPMIHGFTDSPATEDSLNAGTFCEGIARFIETCDTPMTIAIQGDWGSGKSTALQLIQNELKKYNQDASNRNRKIAISQLNTWQYSTLEEESYLSIYLLLSMYNSILECTGQKDSKQMMKHLKMTKDERHGIAKSVAVGSASLVGNGLLNIIVPGAPAIARGLFSAFADFLSSFDTPENGANEKTQSEASIENNEEIRLPAEVVREKIQKLIDNAISPENKKVQTVDRVVLFVDDLDRLKPETALELLEAMKNFFDCKHCVFVLAVDRDVVYQGIKSKYGDSISKQKKQQFFDKIIQLPFNLPVKQYSTSKYFETLLNQRGGKAEASDYSEQYSRIFDSILGTNNPRSIKRILNLWELYQLIYPSYINDADSRMILFGALVLKFREEKNMNALETAVGSDEPGKDDETLLKPYTALTKSASEGTDVLRKFVLRQTLEERTNRNTPIYTFFNELGLCGIENAPSYSNEEGSDADEETDQSEAKLETLQNVLSGISAIFATDSKETSGHEESDNETLAMIRSYYLSKQYVEDHTIARDRYDYWQDEAQVNKTLPLFTLVDKGNNTVNVIFKFEGDRARLIDRKKFAEAVDGKFPNRLMMTKKPRPNGHRHATLYGITGDAYAKAAEKLIDRCLRGDFDSAADDSASDM
jgi:hypothetical protein